MKLKEAQQRCGELLWASQRSRPDLSYAMAVMSSTVSKDPGRAVELGKKMLNYVKDSIDAKIHYPKVVENPGDLVLYTDASFSPQGTRSHSGYLVVWRGVVVAWKSGRQSMITLSSAESEVIAITEGAQMLKAVETTLNDLNIFPTRLVIRIDSTSAISVMSGEEGGSWRTRHLKLRYHWIREQVMNSTLVLDPVIGTLSGDSFPGRQKWLGFCQPCSQPLLSAVSCFPKASLNLFPCRLM